MAQNVSDAAHPLASNAEGDDRYFNTERLRADLGARTARGGAVTFASQGFKFFAGLGATMVLGRLLRPADYGLIGMVAVVILVGRRRTTPAAETPNLNPAEEARLLDLLRREN